MAQLIKIHTAVSDDDVSLYTDRDIYITPEEAVRLKMVDEIITKIS
jgi:ATP-dependent protease ClpP protease subunit